MFTKSTLILITFFLFTPFLVTAQSLIPPGVADTSAYLKIKTSPTNPSPGQEVTASIEYFLTDLKLAEISWFLNDSLQKKGLGETTFKFQNGKLGSVSKISVSISTFEGNFIQKDLILRPAEVDIIWNAQTYTPPFYKGKALFTNRSSLTITAVPNFINSSGSKINPESLVYNWKKENVILVDESGVGKNSFQISGGTITRPLNIKVEVLTLDGSISASKTMEIKVGNPKVLVYEKSPLYGLILNNVLKTFVLKEEEVTLGAIPYFFNTLGKNASNMEYAWTQNNEKINLPVQESSVILRQVDSSLSGKINVGIKALNKENLLQNSNSSVQITVGEQ